MAPMRLLTNKVARIEADEASWVVGELIKQVLVEGL